MFDMKLLLANLSTSFILIANSTSGVNYFGNGKGLGRITSLSFSSFCTSWRWCITWKLDIVQTHYIRWFGIITIIVNNAHPFSNNINRAWGVLFSWSAAPKNCHWRAMWWRKIEWWLLLWSWWCDGQWWWVLISKLKM